MDELKNRGKGSISIASPGTLPGEVVFLAVPLPAVEPIVHQYLELLPGKILVDLTNTVNMQKMEPMYPDSSGAEKLVRLVPADTRVLKAFNTTFSTPLFAGQVSGTPLDVLIAGDDPNAKSILTQLIQSGGLRAIDVGPLVRARQLESFGLLHIAIQFTQNLGFQSAFKLLP